VAAFGIPDPTTGTERVIVVAEAREQSRHRRELLRPAVRDRIVGDIGSPPDVVVIADPHAVLKTPSGKIRRSATRDAYLNGTLGVRQPVAVQRATLLLAALGGWMRRGSIACGRVLFTSWIVLVLAPSLPVLWIYLASRRPGRHADRATRRWARLALALCRHGPITVTIGAPMEPRGTGWPEMVRLRDAAVDHIARACGEALA
jgi:hypothetical protein